MTTDTTGPELDDVLDAYMSAISKPTWPVLREWIRHYPQFAQELTDFTAGWVMLSILPEPPPLTPAEEAELTQRGMAVVRRILDRQAAS